MDMDILGKLKGMSGGMGGGGSGSGGGGGGGFFTYVSKGRGLGSPTSNTVDQGPANQSSGMDDIAQSVLAQRRKAKEEDELNKKSNSAANKMANYAGDDLGDTGNIA